MKQTIHVRVQQDIQSASSTTDIQYALTDRLEPRGRFHAWSKAPASWARSRRILLLNLKNSRSIEDVRADVAGLTVKERDQCDRCRVFVFGGYISSTVTPMRRWFQRSMWIVTTAAYGRFMHGATLEELHRVIGD